VSLPRQSINWTENWRNDFGGGHPSAVIFAQALWCDRVETRSDPFDRAFAMDAILQLACLDTLDIRWGLKKQEARNRIFPVEASMIPFFREAA
jgi:hypothetical protein